MKNLNSELSRYVNAIQKSGLSIYDPIANDDSDLWIPAPALEALLDEGLSGISLAGLPNRTRSKIAKQHVCRVLGYPIPASFRKTKPRFPGQLFDTYVQKNDNLQIWNEELVPGRRYVLIRVSPEGIITHVKVVTGETLALLDTTGTLTQKYQARCIPKDQPTELIVKSDTLVLQSFANATLPLSSVAIPVSPPTAGQLLPISVLFERLSNLIGVRFTDTGYDQERKRGAELHRLVCEAIGYASYQDDGQFPDVRHQLLEVKLQTSPTIDLGLVLPNSTNLLDVPDIDGQPIRHCDVRYAVFYAQTDRNQVTLTHLILTTGEAFFTRFPQFQGKVLNRKLQIPLPSDFFD
jgi:hypothetical protein